jgi:arsenate reductase
LPRAETNVLVLCTGNSCRSVLAEALLRRAFAGQGLQAYSAGTAPKGAVHPLALETLRKNGLDSRGFSSKALAAVQGRDYALVVTVCDSAKEGCPVFPGTTKVIHVGFEDPDGRGPEAFQACFEKIRAQLLPRVAGELGLKEV